MITRYFKTARPIHFVLTLILMVCLFLFYRLYAININFSALVFAKQLIILIVITITMLLHSHTVSKNYLSNKNSYNTLFLFLFLAIIPEMIMDDLVVLSNLFCVMAFYRLITLGRNKSIKIILFDAAFWIGLASLCYFWSILMFVLVPIALLLFSIGKLKNWLVPIIAIGAVYICANIYTIIGFNTFFDVNSYTDPINFNWNNNFNLSLIIGITTILVISIWATYNYLDRIRNFVRIKRTPYILTAYFLLLAILIIVLSPVKSGSVFLFITTPLAIITSSYLETIEDTWFAEILIWTLLLSAIIVFGLQFYQWH